MSQKPDYDYVVIGSGFGGSVAALRLSEKGYRVLVLEKGKELQAGDFPKTNWNLKRWMWLPALRFFGFFKLTFFRHITVLSGVGVGGGSLVYANTLPVPKDDFFEAQSWAHLADWKEELKDFYPRAKKMLGAVRNPRMETGDAALKTLAGQIGKQGDFELTETAVFFGEPDKEVPDPFFGGEGPARNGCNFCGGCMTGCRYNAKNTLDKNYLYLARKKGLKLQAEAKVTDIKPLGRDDGSDGYLISYRRSTSFFKKTKSVTARGVVFSGGVLGTLPLLFDLKKNSLPGLSDQIGAHVRTNSESLTGVTTFDKNTAFSDGVAIGSILHTDAHSHLEPVRYASGSGFWRLMLAPMVSGSNWVVRLGKLLFDLVRHPIQNLQAWFGLKSKLEEGSAPTAFIPEAQELIKRYAKIVNGKPVALLTETFAGIPTTAHILGGCVMGADKTEGVIDKDNRVFGYQNMYVCDGSAISANPGVNPSLTITAISERAMSKIPKKE